MYWLMGERIFNEEQQGKERAEHGAYFIKNLALEIEPVYGSGFSYRQLERSRQFYRTFPIASAIELVAIPPTYNLAITKFFIVIEAGI